MIRSIREAISALKCDNVLEYFFGLNELEVLIYKCLIGKAMKIQEISKEVGRGENAVYKSLQKLTACGLVFREKKCFECGGYYYVYKAVNPNKVAEEMKKEVKKLNERLLDAIEEFEKNFSNFRI